jgi:hypothetical protein
MNQMKDIDELIISYRGLQLGNDDQETWTFLHEASHDTQSHRDTLAVLNGATYKRDSAAPSRDAMLMFRSLPATPEETKGNTEYPGFNQAAVMLEQLFPAPAPLPTIVPASNERRWSTSSSVYSDTIPPSLTSSDSWSSEETRRAEERSRSSSPARSYVALISRPHTPELPVVLEQIPTPTQIAYIAPLTPSIRARSSSSMTSLAPNRKLTPPAPLAQREHHRSASSTITEVPVAAPSRGRSTSRAPPTPSRGRSTSRAPPTRPTSPVALAPPVPPIPSTSPIPLALPSTPARPRTAIKDEQLEQGPQRTRTLHAAHKSSGSISRGARLTLASTMSTSTALTASKPLLPLPPPPPPKDLPNSAPRALKHSKSMSAGLSSTYSHSQSNSLQPGFHTHTLSTSSIRTAPPLRTATLVRLPPPIPEPTVTSRPSKENNYHNFCKGAWSIRTSVQSGLEIVTRPDGLYNSHTLWQCKHCFFQGETFINASVQKGKLKKETTVDTSVYTSASGLRYKWIFLAKSHVRKRSVNAHRRTASRVKIRGGSATRGRSESSEKGGMEDCNFGCVICSAEGKVTGIFGNVETLMSHILLDHVSSMSEVTAVRAKCVVGREAGGDEEWDLNIPWSAEARALLSPGG